MNEQANEQENEKITSELDDTEGQLDEQVGDDEELTVPEVPEDQEVDETIDEVSEDPELKVQDDQPGDEPPPDVNDERFDQIESQIGQLTQGMQQLVSVLQNRPDQGPAAQQQQSLPAQDEVPESVENMTQREAARYVLQEAGKKTGTQVKGVYTDLLKRIVIQGYVMDELLNSHPDKDLIFQAVENTRQSGGVDFPQAIKNARGNASTARLQKLEKTQRIQQRTSRKRARGARKGGQRPTPPVKEVSTRNMSTIEVAKMEARKLGLPVD